MSKKNQRVGRLIEMFKVMDIIDDSASKGDIVHVNQITAWLKGEITEVLKLDNIVNGNK